VERGREAADPERDAHPVPRDPAREERPRLGVAEHAGREALVGRLVDGERDGADPERTARGAEMREPRRQAAAEEGRLGEGARRQGFAFRRVLVVGSGAEAERARAAFEEARSEGFEPLGTTVPAGPGESPEAAAARLRALVESERIQIVCVVPEPAEVPYLLAAATALRDSGAATYWAGSVAQLASEENLASLGGVRAVLLHAPSRGLSVRVRKRASDLFLSLFVAPFRWGALSAYLARRGETYTPAQAWGRVWLGRLSWVGRSAYEESRWANVPGWARLALESIRPGVVTPPDGLPGDPMSRVAADLAYLSRFSVAEDLRQFLRATRGNLS